MPISGGPVSGEWVAWQAGAKTYDLLGYFNVKDYGATGDGVTDDTAEIQAAIDAAGSAGKVFLPPGTYVCSSTLTLPLYGTLEGSTAEYGASGSPATELKFSGLTGSSTAIVLGAYATLRHLTVSGPGATVGTVKGVTGGSFVLDRTTVRAFASGVHATNGHYLNLERVELTRNATALTLTSCYNVTLIQPAIFAAYGAANATHGIGISGGARGLNIFGGSIEGHLTAIQLSASSHLSLVGVYFETAVDTNGWTVRADSLSNISIYAAGCMVYLNGVRSFITVQSSTNTSVVAHGNRFVSVSGSVTTPYCYVTAAGQAFHLTGDDYSEMAKAGAQYVVAGSGTLPGPGQFIQMPAGSGTSAGVTLDGRRTIPKHLATTLADPGAVTMDVAEAVVHNVTLNANATSSSFTNPVPNQEVTVRWIQDGTGGRTYSWPSNACFAGGSAPADTTLNTHTLVRFRYNSSAGRWTELYRAVAVPNS